MRTAARLALAVLCLVFGLSGLWLDRMAADRPAEPVGIPMAYIPAGEFVMGGEPDPEKMVAAFPALHGKDAAYFADEYPRHRVRISRPFWLGRYEVTVGQFRRFVRETGYQTEAEKDGSEGGWGYNPATGKCEGRDARYNWLNPGFAQTDDHPVVNVSHNDALAFCAWLSRKERARYRLPTEAEWEYACRAGTVTRYHQGDPPERLHEVARVLDTTGVTMYGHVHQLIIPATGPFTSPVGSYPPNAWGLYDMHGNVWEWCADWYAEDYYARSPARDPRGPRAGNVRVRRGGGWTSFPLYARSSFRNYNNAPSRCVNLGFRVLREVGP